MLAWHDYETDRRRTRLRNLQGFNWPWIISAAIIGWAFVMLGWAAFHMMQAVTR